MTCPFPFCTHDVGCAYLLGCCPMEEVFWFRNAPPAVQQYYKSFVREFAMFVSVQGPGLLGDLAYHDWLKALWREFILIHSSVEPDHPTLYILAQCYHAQTNYRSFKNKRWTKV